MKRSEYVTASAMFLITLISGILLIIAIPDTENCMRIGRVVAAYTQSAVFIQIIEFAACLLVASIVWGLTYWVSAHTEPIKAVVVMLFLLVIFAPILVGWRTDFSLEDTENRMMAEKPVLEVSNLTNYFQQMDSYIADYVPFRKVWLRENGLIRYGIFHSSNKPITMPGENGWIYYGADGMGAGEDPVADYKQTNLFSEEELADFCASLQGFKNYLSSQGKEFCLMVNLNKSHIYPEYLPENLKEGEGITRAEQLIAYLDEHSDIEIVYPKDALLEAKKDYLLYCPTDAHWNTVGGYVGFVELMKALEPEYTASAISEISPEYYRSNWGDVANIVNAAWFTDNQWTTTYYKTDIALEWTYRTPDNSSLYIDNPAGNGEKILVYHDSYMNQMMEYIGKEYSSSEFIEKEFNINEEDITAKNPDIVVFEILERMLNNYTEELRYWQKYK